jgi:hypothetical protein
MYQSNHKPIEPETPRSTKVIEVIEVVCGRGNGQDNVFRLVKQYWSKDGKLLAENDPCEGMENA